MNLSPIHQTIEQFPLAFAGVTIMALLIASAVIYKHLRHHAKTRLKSASAHQRR